MKVFLHKSITGRAMIDGTASVSLMQGLHDTRSQLNWSLGPVILRLLIGGSTEPTFHNRSSTNQKKFNHGAQTPVYLADISCWPWSHIV